MKKKTSGGTMKTTVRNLILTVVFAFIYFYVTLPPINLQSEAFYTFVFLTVAVFCGLTVLSAMSSAVKSKMDEEPEDVSIIKIIKSNCLIPALVCVVLLVFMLVGQFLSSPVLRASAYSKLLSTDTGNFTEDINEISYSQIPMLDKASAQKLGDRKLGELSDMVSQFEVADDYTQINYKGKPVRVTPLLYGDLIKWFNNRSAGLPAYLIIDMVTQSVEVVRLPDGMKYSTGEHFGRNLYRHIRFSYPTYIFDEPTFEIDDDGTPYWVCPRVVKRIGLFGGKDIDGAVLVNAVTGESEYYEEVPEWVDIVYTADLIIQQYDYYGTYKNGFINSLFGQRDVTVTTDGYNYIASDDDVYMYTGITSVGTDESNVGFILTNMRTKATTYYAIPGAEEYSAMASAEGIVQHLGYRSTFPLLLNIASQPTYFMSLKDSAGLVKMYAMVNVSQYQVVATATTVAECERNYVDLLISRGIISGDQAEIDTVSGTVEDIRTAVIDGNTQIYIKLQGSSVYYVVSAADAPVAVLLSTGDVVEIAASSNDGDIISAYSLTLISHNGGSGQDQQ